MLLLGVISFATLSGKINYRRLTTDSGFDSSWDSGGSDWDSGSSWDSSSSDYSSGSGGGDPVAGMVVLFIIIIFVIIAVSTSSSSKSSGTQISSYTPTIRVLSEADKVLLGKYGYNDFAVLNDAYKCYVDIQKAWSENDIDKARNQLSPALYSQYKAQIAAMVAKKERNEMSGFKCLGGGIESIREQNGALEIDVILEVNCKDYLVSTTNNSVLRGSSSKINYYKYSLTFVITHGNEIDKCPNCNAEIKDKGATVKCEYCGSTIERRTNSLTLTRKRMLNQR